MNVSDWISVQDERPPRDLDVLVFDCGAQVVVVAKYTAYGWMISHGYDFDLEVVTHWIPLPEPPKGGDL